MVFNAARKGRLRIGENIGGGLETFRWSRRHIWALEEAPSQWKLEDK